MPFGIINAGATFQCGMNFSISDLKDKIIVIYLDDLIVFSKKRKDHIKDLERVLKRCRDYGVPLNPKKSICCVTEGKLLCHIVSEEGVRIDLERVKTIHKLSLPLSTTRVKHFFDNVNFLRRFMPNFSKLVKSIVDMMKCNKLFKYSNIGKGDFEDIKSDIAKAPVHLHPDYNKEFIVYFYALDHTMLAKLM